jgi:hypothetical protein
MTLINPLELSDGELDIVAAGCNSNSNHHRDDGGGTTVQISILSAQADDGSNAGLIVVGNQSA